MLCRKIISVILIYLCVFTCLIPGIGIKNEALAAYAPTQQTLTVGGQVFTDLDNLIILIGWVASASTHTTMRKLNASSGYTPSGTKSFRLWAIKGWSSGGTPAGYSFSYSDNDVVIDAGTALVNPVTPGAMNIAEARPYLVNTGGQGATNGSGEMGFGKTGFLMPNAKFFQIGGQSASGIWVYAYGYEE